MGTALFLQLLHSLRLLRSSICATFLMTFGSCWLVTHRFEWFDPSIWLAALAVSLTTAFGNVQNDLLDVRIDAVNCPTRPLPSGRVAPRTALRLAQWLFVTALICAALSSRAFLLLTSLALTLTLIYNLWAKRVPLLGNLIVASLYALCLTSGYFVFPGAELPLIPIITTLLFFLARELIATILDHPGDQLGGRLSVYALWGMQGVLMLSLLLTLVAVAIAAIPSLTLPSPLRLYYLVSILLTFILPVLIASIAIVRDPSRANLRPVWHRLRYVYLSTFVSFLWLV